MVISDIVKLVRLKINDLESIQFADEDVLMIVNEGLRFIREIYMDEMPETICDIKTENLDAGDNKIILDDKLLKIIDIRVNGKSLHYSKLKDIRDLGQIGTPKVYAVVKDSIMLYPIPNTACKCNLQVVAESPELDFLDEFPYPVDFAQFVQEYASVRLGTIDGANVTSETQVFAQLRNSIVSAINKLTPEPCVVDSYY